MSDSKKAILMRAYLIYILVLIFGGIILGRIIYLQFVQGDYWSKQASIVNSKTEVIDPVRGNIFADDESLLATSVPIFEIRLDLDSSVISDTVFKSKIDSLAENLCRLFEGNSLNKKQYKKELIKGRLQSNRGFLIRKKATYAELKLLKTFPILRLGNRGGLIVYTKDRRERPFKNLASMTIGYERLSEYKVVLNLKASKIKQEKFDHYIDTLAQCFSNLFQDYNRESYKKKLIAAYASKGPTAKIVKNMNELQLAELKTFPLIEDDTINIIKQKQLTKSYFVGLEGHYRNDLRGERGVITLKKVGNNSWKKISDEDLIEPKNGCDLYTSIDVNLQDVAQNALRKSLDTTNADWGCVILMEVQTGFVKAIANLTRDKDGAYQEMRNYAVEELYEPGSTFKLASVVAVLEDGTFDTNTIVNTGKKNYSGWGTVVDSHEDGYGRVSLSKAFEKSSNVGITEIAYRAFGHNPQKFQQLLEKMGLTQKSGIDIDNEPQPRIKVSYGDLLGIAFGYALKVTPMQVLTFYNAIANNGKYMKPMFVKEIKRTGVSITKFNPVVLKDKICSDATLLKIKKLLEGVVIRGTATNIRNSVYKIAGKTGTAKIYDPITKGYLKSYVASFAGYFPADDPKFSCIVVEYNMKGSEIYGAQVAAPVFKEIADRVYATRVDIKSKESTAPSVLSIPQVQVGYKSDIETIYQGLDFKFVPNGSSSDWVGISTFSNSIFEKDKTFQSNIIPNVVNMKAKDAIYMLESAGLTVIVKGKGTVSSQSLKPGERIGVNKQIIITLTVS